MKWYFKALRKYAVFSGRARRREFWWFWLISYVIWLFLASTFSIPKSDGYVAEISFSYLYLHHIFAAIVFLPALAVGVRRMHDTDRSGWWIIAPIINLVFAFSKGTEGDNRFGSDPKADTR